MSLAFMAEQQVAVAAVKRACALTSSVFNKLVKNETLVKGDKSPVTGLHNSQCPWDNIY
jgi:3'(2'), 5'-bisphosphate nucleotidase